MQTASKAVDVFATNEKVANVVRKARQGEKCFTPKMLETHSVFVCVKDKNVDILAPLMSIITSTTLQYLSSRPFGKGVPIMVCLDEFSTAVKYISGFEQCISKLRKSGNGCRIAIVIQSYFQLYHQFGHDVAKIILDNFTLTGVYSVNNYEMKKNLAESIGMKEIVKKSISTVKAFGAGSVGKRVTTSKDTAYHVKPEEFGELEGNGKMILMHTNGYYKLKKAPYYKEKQKINFKLGR